MIIVNKTGGRRLAISSRGDFHIRRTPQTMTCAQRCQIWMERAMVRNKRTTREHEIAMHELYIQLRGRGIHSLSIAQRMDITHYCIYRGASDIFERSSFSSSFYREECVAAFNYQSAIYRHRITPQQGINFLTPQISQEKKAGIQINIEPFFTALNSTIELEQEPLHLLNLGIDCLNIIGEMVAKDNQRLVCCLKRRQIIQGQLINYQM